MRRPPPLGLTFVDNTVDKSTGTVQLRGPLDRQGIRAARDLARGHAGHAAGSDPADRPRRR